MSLNFDPIYLIWLFVAVSAGLAAEAVYLLGFSAASYRSQINRRLMLRRIARIAKACSSSCGVNAGSPAAAITGSTSSRSTG